MRPDVLKPTPKAPKASPKQTLRNQHQKLSQANCIQKRLQFEGYYNI